MHDVEHVFTGTRFTVRGRLGSVETEIRLFLLTRDTSSIRDVEHVFTGTRFTVRGRLGSVETEIRLFLSTRDA